MLPANFNQLYYFWTIAREGSISSAKERLYLTQSTLSVQIQKLERSLGKKLFSRERHGVVLTNEGRLVFDYCDRLFGQADEFFRLFSENKTLSNPSLKLGISPAISHGIILRILKSIHSAGLDNRLQVYSGGWDELKVRLARRKVDLVVADADYSSELGPDYRGRLVARLPLWFVGSARWRSQIKRFPEGLNTTPILLRNPENPARKQVDHYFFEQNLSPSIVAEVESVDLIRLLLLRHEGVAALDLLSVDSDLRERTLFKLHKKPLPIHQEVWFLFRRHRRDEPALQKAIDILMDTFQLPT